MRWAVCWAVVGCTSAVAPLEPVAPDVAPVAAPAAPDASLAPVLLGAPWAPPAPDEVVAVDVEGGAVTLKLAHIGQLHRRFFTDPRLLPPLGDLAVCGGPAPVAWVHWDPRQEVGRLVLEVGGPCAPSLDADGVAIGGLTPAFDAVLGWRSRVAGLRDLRVAAFQVGVMASDATGYGVLWAAGRTPEAGLRGCYELDGDRACTATRDGVPRLPVREADRARLMALWTR